MASNLLIDSNVILDIFLKREPFFSMSVRAVSLSRSHDINNFISASSVTDIYYLAYKNLKDHQALRKMFKDIFEFVDVVKVIDKDIHKAFSLNWKDFEDSVQYAVALHNDFDGIVTRNMKGFADSEVKIFTPEEVCRYVDENLKE